MMDMDATSATWKEEQRNAIKLWWLEAAKAAHSKIILKCSDVQGGWVIFDCVAVKYWQYPLSIL